MIKIATICSGIGAPEKALRNLGIPYDLTYFCEIDKYASQSYCAIHGEPQSKNLGDLTQVKIEKLPRDIDLLVGGTPCQDFSIAGKRAGGEIDKNTRSSLMWNFVEIIRETKPKVVLWENVPGCLTQGTMRNNFYKFLQTLGELGYKTHSELLNSKNFGVPQNRERVFVVAVQKQFQPLWELDTAPVTKIDITPKFEMPQGYDCGIRLKDVLETDVPEKFYLSEKLIACLQKPSEKWTNKWKAIESSGVAKTIVAHTGFGREDNALCVAFNVNPSGKGMNGNVYHATGIAPTVTTNKGEGNKLIELTKDTPQANRVYDPNGISRNLVAEAGGGGAKTGLYQVPRGYNKGGFHDECPTITGSKFQYNNVISCAIRGRGKSGELKQTLETNGETANAVTTVQKDSLVLDIYNKQERTDGLAGTLTKSTSTNGSGTFGVLENTRVRKLTPSECFKLMGFTDEDHNACKAANVSDSQLYKQTGNSIVVNVLMAIFGNLYGKEWQQAVYGKWWKTESERMLDLPLFKWVM